MVFFTKSQSKVAPEDATKRVSSITVRVYISNCTGTFYITDLLLQGGTLATGWVGHPSEIQWTLDG